MALKYCGVVDSEGGLLLLGDAATLHLWRGSDNEQTQFSRIKSAVREGLPGLNIPIFQEEGVIWDIEGPGTADVFFDESLYQIIIVRCWLAESDSEDAVLPFGSIPADLGRAFAEFEIDSGVLAIIDDLESGNCIQSADGLTFSLSEVEMMTVSSGMLLAVMNGRYRCFHDVVKTEQREARRCHIIRVRNQ